MLNRLFGKSRAVSDETTTPQGAVSPDTRLYVVGDIHGCLDLLSELQQLIHEDAYRVQAARNVLVYLGDYIDRGADSKGVVDRLIDAPLPGFECIHLKGNHEAALLDFLQDVAIGPDWLGVGGTATLQSYGVRVPDWAIDREAMLRAQAELRHLMPREHRDFYRSLRLSHLEGDFLMVHAGVRPGVPLEAQSEGDLLWIREQFLRSNQDFGKIVVHGHTIAELPELRRNRIGIDTGAFHSGRLTCLVVQGAELGFLQT